MSAEIFHSVVNLETVYSFGINPDIWRTSYQADLHEVMILILKENPDMTLEEAKDRCYDEVQNILLRRFKNTYGNLVLIAPCYKTYEHAFDDFLELGQDAFEAKLNESVEYSRFCSRFYERLRERYNICSAGMWDEYKKMKANNWTMNEYARQLREKRET